MAFLAAAAGLASSIGGIGGLAAGVGFAAGAAAPAVLTGLSIAGAAKSLFSQPKAPTAAQLPAPPSAPSFESATTQAKEEEDKRRRQRTPRRLTGANLLSEATPTVAKTLLGA